MKYEIYFKPEDPEYCNRVFFEDGTDYCIHKDTDGRGYFSVPNMFIIDRKFKLFSDKIKDAIETIRNGDGDILHTNCSIFGGTTEWVYRYVDRVYGEEMRMKTIEDFKDVIFGYSLKFGYNTFMNGGKFISKDKKLLPLLGNREQNNFIYFDNEKEAENFKKEIIDKAEELRIKCEEIKEDKIEIKKFIHSLDYSIYSDVLFALTGKDSWYLKVVQVIKP